MRKTFAWLMAFVFALAVVGQAPRATRPVFTPQIPTASREDMHRVFLEQADILYKERNDSFMIVAGNVIFTRGPMIMTCDSAHYYTETESFDAFGNVHMEQGDTLFIYADELNYRGPEQTCYLYANPGKKVRLINRDVTLETDIFTYDLGINLGYYTVGGVLYDKRNRLTSLEGEYNPDTKEANFYYNVHLNSHGDNDTLDIYTDTLYYNTETHISELTSQSVIINARGTIYTRDGLYDTALDTAVLYARSLVTTPTGRTMTADTIYYDRPAGIGKCYGYMILTDSARQASLSADYGFFNQSTDSAYATGRLLIKEYSKGDTLYLHGRQVNAYRVYDTINIPAIPADTLTGTPEVPASFRVDTNNVADVWPRVRFFRSDMQGICDSMRVSRADTTLYMYVSPVVWSDYRQISGNVIELLLNDSTIREAHLPDYGFTLQRVADVYYDQLAGKEMVATFEEGQLRRLDVSGNVEMIMYPEEADSTFNKLVTAQSSFMTVLFKGQTTEYVKLWPETSGQAVPLFQVRKSMLYLPKFTLFEGMRPLSPADVMTVPIAMEELMETAQRPAPPAPKPKRPEITSPMPIIPELNPADESPESDIADEEDTPTAEQE